MKAIAAVFPWTGAAQESRALECLTGCSPIGEKALALMPGAPVLAGPIEPIPVPSLWSRSSVVDILRWFDRTQAEHLLWILPGAPLISSAGLERLWRSARDADAALTYGDYFDLHVGAVTAHPLTDYQPGSLRDDFDFGAMVLLSRKALSGLAQTIDQGSPDLRYGGWYDLRLRVVERGSVLHLPEPIYQMPPRQARPSGERVFDYVDSSKRDCQLEMEAVATAHLSRIGALLDPPTGVPVQDDRACPVEASVVIPVKNRARTIADAVRSALSQKTRFDFNVIVVDNHSEDGTSGILGDLAARERRLVHLVPERRDLQIGGCWNEAIYSEHCGRIAVQLDSDDLYDGTTVLERMVLEIESGRFAVVIGAYTTVDFTLQRVPPGLVDHREWTDSNGHNNALRISGLGAPRAFHVPTLRTVGFPNVSYGEDYAVVLRLCGTYPLGRIYDSLYWCRRWEGNSDSALSLETANRYASYKDTLRTIEIARRRRREASR